MHYLICFSNFIDDQGKINAKQLRANDVCNLPTNERIGVHWNNETQPIGDSGALLNRFFGGRFLKIIKKIYLKTLFR